MEINLLKRTIGLNFSTSGTAIIWLWAPNASLISLFIPHLNELIPMVKDAFGYWILETDQLKNEQEYSFKIEKVHLDKENSSESESIFRSDPASVFQYNGVKGNARAYDLEGFTWDDQSWQGVELSDLIIYELHTGTFSDQGNFKSIEDKLDYLIELGITAIELLPVAQFPGTRNWGYDGVYPFAVQNSYGGPQALQHLVNTCHKKGLAVILDVVYNHMGPEGNYFNDFGPYFTSKYQTPWGKAINFDDANSDPVRQYFIENVLMWFRDFHIDALRMDAVHAINDFGAVHILAEMKQYVNELSKINGKKYQLIAELDLNDNKYINPLGNCGFGLDGQWVDEFHHALRVAAGQEKNGYYADFNGIEHLAKSYQDAYVYDGQYSPHRKKKFGKKALGNNGKQFVVFSQNHDQIGNRMLGERTSMLVSFEMQKLLAAAVFVSPFLPLIFMGEEYGETNPFQFFISHNDPELIEAVRKGRKAEFAAFHSEEETPDPQSEDTFLRSKLNWNAVNEPKHRILLNYYKALISLRKTHPALSNLVRENLKVSAIPSQNCLILHRWFEDHEVLCLMNFSKFKQQLNVDLNIQRMNIFDSSTAEWNEKYQSQNQPDQNGKVSISPESIIIFSTTNV